ncbi:MAG: hypothetical protein WCL08_01085 [Verrucomicrobiota bacterium]
MADTPQMELWKLGCKTNFRLWFETAGSIQDKSGKLITPKMNRMQDQIDEAIRYCHLNNLPFRGINLKPRQGGSSSYFIGRAYHSARSSVVNVAILGDDKNTTEKLMRMWKRYGANDIMSPYWSNKEKTEAWLEFTHGSTLTLETANDPRAGQGGTYQVLIASEVASYRSSGHSTGEDVFSSIAACVPDLPGTMVALESTAQGMTGIFYSTYQGAVTLDEFKVGKTGNGYIKFFTAWFEFDDYQHDGQAGRKQLSATQRQFILDTLDERERDLIRNFGDTITPERMSWRREAIAGPLCGGNPDTFDREFPQDAISCFRSTGSAFFDLAGVTWQEHQRITLETRIQRGDIMLFEGRGAQWMPRRDGGGEFRVFELPREGESYLISADFCVGKQAAGSKGERDAHAFYVWRAERINPATGEHRLAQCVASTYADNQVDTDVAIQQLLKLHRLYGDCTLAPEKNNKDNICQQLFDAGIKRIWKQPQGANGLLGSGKTSDVMGWLTTEGTRKQILDNLLSLVREQAFIATFPEIVHQMKVFIRNARGKAEAAPGEHDDAVMSSAIGLFCIGWATPYVPPGLQAAQTRATGGVVDTVLEPFGL